MNDEMLETVEATTGDSVEGSVIWLHGLGADGHDFEPIAPYLGGSGLRLRFVFPHAPVRPVTLNGGIPMRAWFDILSLDRGSRQDESGIRTAESQVNALIRRENERGIPTDKIVLAGFSQGGALALHSALRYSERFAGIVALSTYLPLRHKVEAEAGDANRKTPFMMSHGSRDPLVPPHLGEETRDFLRDAGYSVEWKSYPMDHAVCPEQIADLRVWLADRF